jgi:sensor histidine kinase regulating citrate/malate metabolism
MFDNEECLLLLLRDVTEFHQLQQQKQQVSMMKMLHATVSHDMMNPISAI